MKISINNTILYIKSCNSFKNRFIGMMGKKNINYDGYFFPNCKSLHTFFMFQNIDIYMVDKNNIIIKVFNNIKPWKIIFGNKKVYGCYEFTTRREKFKVGDEIKKLD